MLTLAIELNYHNCNIIHSSLFIKMICFVSSTFHQKVTLQNNFTFKICNSFLKYLRILIPSDLLVAILSYQPLFQKILSIPNRVRLTSLPP